MRHLKMAHFCLQTAYTIAKITKICYNRDMDLFFTLILTAIFAETSFLSLKQISKNSLRGGRIARRRVFVDTSALMDGRILAVAKAGFLGDELLSRAPLFANSSFSPMEPMRRSVPVLVLVLTS